ncbi:MAG: heptose kinase [Gammaproteobacteria bacterium]|nr:heptose kinase [Gammaproteobacteria bacterium]
MGRRTGARTRVRWENPSGIDGFGSWSATVALARDGELLSNSGLNSLARVQGPRDETYYVKEYRCRGRHLRRYLGRSRARAEWENLHVFRRLGLNTARPVAFGEDKDGRGIVVTQAVHGAVDLATLAREAPLVLNDPAFQIAVGGRLADATATLHESRFAHGDLKWRNILVHAESREVFLIDCPQGRMVPRVLLERARVKDLACLDKVARRYLSRTRRLWFYKKYAGIRRLSAPDKKRIGRILRFFEGRE